MNQDMIKIIRFFAIVSIVLAVIALIDQQSKIKTGKTINEEDITSGESSQEETVRQEIHIPRNIQIAEGETVEIIEPKATLTGHHSSDDPDIIAQECAEDLKTQGIMVEKAYGNKDGSITEVFDAVQLENYILYIEKLLQERVDNDRGIPIVIREDFMQITYYVSDGCTLEDFGYRAMVIDPVLVIAQVLSGVPGNEWTLTETIVYRDTGQVMLELVSNKNNGYKLSAKEWEEKMQEMREQSQE